MKLSGEGVDALFSGMLASSDTPPSIPSFGRLPKRQWDTCSVCGERSQGLFSFDSPTAWQMSVPPDAPIREVVRKLRRTTDARTIAVCWWCIQSPPEAIDDVPNPAPPTQQTML